jgi:core-2/I-Branching enzyme
MQHPDFDFYIHVDKKIDIRPYLFLANIQQVYLIHNRVEVVWGGYATVETTLQCTKEILATGREYDYIHLMSGQDYPIKSAAYIHDFFARRQGQEFMEFEPFDTWSAIDPWSRIRQYHFTNYNFPGRYLLQRIMNKLLPVRVPPVELDFFGSSMFWALSPASLRFVIDFLESNPRLQRFMRLSWGTDEFLIQTLVMNSPFKHRVLNDNLLYLDWELGSSHPNIITSRHFQALASSDKLFTRKLDINTDAAIFDRLDDYIGETGSQAPAARVPATAG